MPLAWAHAELIKLAVSRPSCDRPEAVWKRLWRRQETVRRRILVALCPDPDDGRGLRPRRCAAPGRNRAFGVSNGWREVNDFETFDTGLGFWVAELDRVHLKEGQSIDFTNRWQQDGWTGVNYRIDITGSGQSM